MHLQTSQERDHTERQKRVSSFLSMRGYDAIVTTEITSGKAGKIELELQRTVG